MRSIKSLDGLRAFSILLVLLGHSFQGMQLPNTDLLAVLGNSSLGVTIFFVISGFLITHLLLNEHKAHGSISLKRFYLRRAFRILPPFYLYLGFVLVLSLLGYLHLSSAQALSASFFCWDYFPTNKTWALQHLWSLSVEEQFYLFWPVALIFALRRGRGAAWKIALAVILLSPLIRLATFKSHILYMHENMNYMLHTRLDALMSGCMVALAQGEPWFERIYRAVSRYVYLLIAYVVVVDPILILHFGGFFRYMIGYTVEGFAIGFSLLWLTRNTNTIPGRILNAAPVRWLGVLSYSLYLWQTIFLHENNHTRFGHLPLSLIAILVCSCISFYCVERPALKLRDRFMQARKVLVAA